MHPSIDNCFANSDSANWWICASCYINCYFCNCSRRSIRLCSAKLAQWFAQCCCNAALKVYTNCSINCLFDLYSRSRPVIWLYCETDLAITRAQPLRGQGVWTPKIWTDHPNFFDEECDYHCITDCSARSWVYHTYFVLYNNLDQGIGPPTSRTSLRPCSITCIVLPVWSVHRP